MAKRWEGTMSYTTRRHRVSKIQQIMKISWAATHKVVKVASSQTFCLLASVIMVMMMMMMMIGVHCLHSDTACATGQQLTTLDLCLDYEFRFTDTRLLNDGVCFSLSTFPRLNQALYDSTAASLASVAPRTTPGWLDNMFATSVINLHHGEIRIVFVFKEHWHSACGNLEYLSHCCMVMWPCQ